jgi:regulatory protein
MPSCDMAEMKPAGPAPTRSKLHEAALAHLARYGTTQAGLIRVLDRRVDRWARRAENVEPETLAGCRRAVREVAQALVASGVIDDAAFAESRARSLTRAGRSQRAVAAHLGARGVAQDTVREALPGDPEIELAACLAATRRRRIGAFRRPDAEADELRELGVLARAGFGHEVASRALAMEFEEAEAMVIRLKQS